MLVWNKQALLQILSFSQCAQDQASQSSHAFRITKESTVYSWRQNVSHISNSFCFPKYHGELKTLQLLPCMSVSCGKESQQGGGTPWQLRASSHDREPLCATPSWASTHPTGFLSESSTGKNTLRAAESQTKSAFLDKTRIAAGGVKSKVG